MSNDRTDSWAGVRHVLCVRLDAFGDVLMTGPALQDIKSRGCQVTLLTSASGAEAAKMMPYVDRIIVFSAPWMKASADPDPALLITLARQLADMRFDAAVILTVYTQNPLPAAMLCHMAGIPLRLAYCRENPYALLTDWVAETDTPGRIRHEVERQQALVAHAGFANRGAGIRISISPEACLSLREKLAGKGADSRDQLRIVVHAGATAPSRRWPPGRFAAAVSLLRRHWQGAIVFTGTADETELVEQIRREIPEQTISLAGELSTPELAALIGSSALLISNNTGPAHVAAATGTPVVVLYALTNPQHTPWRVPAKVLFHDVPCRYCYKSVCPQGHGECLTLVSPEQVAAAAMELLSLPDRVVRPAALPPHHEPGRLPASTSNSPSLCSP